MGVNGAFAPDEFFLILLSLLPVAMLAFSIPLPMVFRNGIEKGRITYYVMVGIVCGAGVLFSKVFKDGLHIDLSSGILFALLAILGIGVYALSWHLSVVFYQKREL